jgi:hypothetical protein
MQKKLMMVSGLVALFVLIGIAAKYSSQDVLAGKSSEREVTAESLSEPVVMDGAFSVDVLVHGRRLTEHAARGRRYIEALENAEYELRIHNPLGSRVAVALSVDGMNTIDARHTSAWDARKWVIEPYGTIYVRGWQMSSESARRFYFTTERDSYGAKIGQTANVGVISAVFFRERKPFGVTPITRGRGEERPIYKDGDRARDEKAPAQSAESAGTTAGRDAAKQRSVRPYPPPDDESAATGIGRTVSNGVQWIKMDLDSRPVDEITIRYEYRTALVRLGIIPRDYPRQDVLDRRERAEGFEPRYCPQP